MIDPRRIGASLALLTMVTAATLSGCATMSNVGEDYAKRGADELAVYYFTAAWREDGDSQSKARLIQAIQVATRKLNMRYNEALEQKKYREALGLATRKVELYLYAQREGLPGFMPEVAERDVQRVVKHSAQEALHTLDASAGKKGKATEMLRLAREALALNPDDPDLSSRYATMRGRMERKVMVNFQGPTNTRGEARRAAGRILKVLTAADRELFVIVPRTAGDADMELRVAVDLKHGDTGWRRRGKGKIKTGIQRYNRFNEVIRDSKGKARLQTVVAFWQSFERTRRLNLSLSVWLIDLRSHKTLYSRRLSVNPHETRRYFTYTGDPRALMTLQALPVTRLGLRAEAPPPAWKMLETALPQLASQHAKALLNKLEYH